MTQPPYGQQPPQEEPYGQQPPQGESYGRQPPQGESYGQQPPQGESYGQQPPQGESYGQQPPQGESYGQQPPQGQSYGQQPNPQSQYRGQQSSSAYGQNPPQGASSPQNPDDQYGRQQPPQRTVATSKGRFNVTVAVLAAIAAVLGLLSLFLLGWYRNNFASVSGGEQASSTSKFNDIHDMLKSTQQSVDSDPTVSKYVHFGIAPTYFGWLGYALIIAAVVLTFISAASLGGAVVAVKALSALVAAAGLAATFWAVDQRSVDSQLKSQLAGSPHSYGDWLKHTSFGAWAMMLAFLLCLIGSLLPPKRRIVETAPERY